MKNDVEPPICWTVSDGTSWPRVATWVTPAPDQLRAADDVDRHRSALRRLDLSLGGHDNVDETGRVGSLGGGIDVGRISLCPVWRCLRIISTVRLGRAILSLRDA